MKMLARAPTKWLGMMFAVSLFLSVCLLLNPLKAKAVGDVWTHPYNGSDKKNCNCSYARSLGGAGRCGCNGDPKLKYCWYRNWYEKCGGHSWSSGWVTAVGDCKHSAGVIAHCGLCGQNLYLNYPPRQHDWGAWTTLDANKHIHYCKNTSDYTIDVGNNVGTVTVYNKCNEYETAPHNWSGVYSVDQNQHAWNCTTCGYVYKENHKWSAVYDVDGNRHAWKCTTCGYIWYENHKFTDWQDNPASIDTQATDSVSYSTHVHNIGWQNAVKDGATAGTTRQNLQVEAFTASLTGGLSGSIEYRAHVQNVGWQGWVKDGATAGTTGKNLQVEAFQMRLSGQVTQKYNLYYRAHVQDVGWQGWVKDGSTAGTTGYGLRVEAIQVKLVPKGGHSRYCTVCGRAEYGQHAFTPWSDNRDGRHVRHCTVCGRTEYGKHTYGDWYDNGDDFHIRECRTCGSRNYGVHTYSNIKVESCQSSSHDKTVTYSFGCTDCPRKEYVKLTLHVSGSGEKATESSRYKRSGACPVSESAEYYKGTGTAEFWLDKNGSASYITTNNKIVSQSVSIDGGTGDRTSKNVNDKASGNSNTFTWNQGEGVRYFRYTMTDLRGHTYSIATDFSYLLDHTPPQISVSVNLPGQVSGNRTNSMSWTENAATMSTGQSPKPESAWSNKVSPTIAIQCTTHDLNNPTEIYDHMREIRLYKKTKDRSGNETTALLKVWNNVRSAVYTIPKGREGVIVGSENPYGEGTGTYYIVAIDDLNRRTINYGSCPELVDTRAIYNRLNGNNDYDYGLHNFTYDVNHVTVTPLTVHLDYTNPKIKDLTGNNPDNKGENRIVKSVLQFRASDNDYGYANSVNDNSDLSSVTLYGFTSDKQKHTIASYSRNGNDPFRITMPNNIGAFTLLGEGAVWIGGSDTKTLSPNQILSLSFPSDPYLSRQTSTTGSILLDCSRTPGLSNIQYESYAIEVYDRAGNKGVVNNIRTTQALVNELHTTIDRSSYK